MSNTILNKVKSLGSLNVNKFNQLNTDIKGFDKSAFEVSKSKFEKQLQQAKIMKSAKAWIKSDEGKAKLNEIGFSDMTVKLLMTEVYGYESPKFPNRMIQVYTAIAKDGELKKKYVKACKDESLQTSIQGFLKWNKKVTANGGDADGVKAKSESGREKSKATFTFDLDGKKVHARIDSQGNFKSPCETVDVKKALMEMLKAVETSEQNARISAGVNMTTADLS
tara:strand:- start:528 stop:1196 length:669 start_codon:yes stop_codon:yes gene_type:complete